jgi:hypothetical protein
MLNSKLTEYSVLRSTIEMYEVSLCKKFTIAEEILHAPNITQNLKCTIKNNRQ